MKRNNNTTDLPQFLSLAEVADVTGLSQRTIHRRVKDGSLKATRVGPRIIRVERDWLLEWIGQSGSVTAAIG